MKEEIGVYINEEGVLYKWKNRRMYVNKVEEDRLMIVFKSLIKMLSERQDYYKNNHVNYFCAFGRDSEYGVQHSIIHVDRTQFECMLHSVSVLNHVTKINKVKVENHTI